MNDDEFPEPFGPQYVEPPSKECPCCSARLCERGRRSVMRCSGQRLRDDSLMQLVSGCPRSAETTEGTHAWRQARIRITRHATERADGLVLTKIRIAPDVSDGASPEAGQGAAR